MASITALQPAPATRSIQGIACICIGMAFFVGQDAMMKGLLQTHTLWELMVVRSCLASLILVPAIILLGAPHRLLTPWWTIHLTRAFLFALAFSCFYAAFPFMTLASVSTIFFASPLITSLMAVVFLKEKIGVYRSTALVVGFGGVLIALNPGADTFEWIAILPLICAVCYSASQILMRQIGDEETTLTAGAYTIIFAGMFIAPMGYLLNITFGLGDHAPHLRWEWFGPTGETWLVLLGLGLIGMAGYLLLCRAYQVADASLVAPFEYIYLPVATLLGFLVWQEVPTQATLIGMALIMGSGLYIGYRETKSSQRKDTPAPTADVSFVPGNAATPLETGSEDDPPR